MPHIIVEYSANIEAEAELETLFRTLRDVAVETGVFPLSGTRVRGAKRKKYLIADGHPDNAFLHVVLRVGHGRDETTLKEAGDTIYAALCDHLQGVFDTRPMNISMDIQEIHPVLTFKRNNMAEHMERHAADTTQAAE